MYAAPRTVLPGFPVNGRKSRVNGRPLAPTSFRERADGPSWPPFPGRRDIGYTCRMLRRTALGLALLAPAACTGHTRPRPELVVLVEPLRIVVIDGETDLFERMMTRMPPPRTIRIEDDADLRDSTLPRRYFVIDESPAGHFFEPDFTAYLADVRRRDPALEIPPGHRLALERLDAGGLRVHLATDAGGLHVYWLAGLDVGPAGTSVTLTLEAADVPKLEAFTRAHNGRQIAIMFGDTTVSVRVVQEPVRDGRLTVILPAERLEALLRRVRGHQR